MYVQCTAEQKQPTTNDLINNNKRIGSGAALASLLAAVLRHISNPPAIVEYKVVL